MTKNANTLPVSAAYESGNPKIIGFLAGVTGPNEFYERSYELAPNASAAEGETGQRLREQYRTITVGGFLGDGYGIEGKQVDLELYVSLSDNRDSLSDLVLSVTHDPLEIGKEAVRALDAGGDFDLFRAILLSRGLVPRGFALRQVQGHQGIDLIEGRFGDATERQPVARVAAAILHMLTSTMSPVKG